MNRLSSLLLLVALASGFLLLWVSQAGIVIQPTLYLDIGSIVVGFTAGLLCAAGLAAVTGEKSNV